MTGLSAEFIEVLLKQLSDRFALAILFASLFCFAFMLGPWQSSLWMRDRWMWPFFGGVFAICYLPTRFILDRASEFYSNRKRLSFFRFLTAQEREFLSGYVRYATRIQDSSRNTIVVARSLATAGIIVETKSSDQFSYPYFEITLWAYAHLMSHTDLVIDAPESK
jgi:hypothetical protein